MWIYSPEMFNAIEVQGYKFNIIKGYYFEKANIFKEFVEDLYNLRLKYPKSDPMNMIAKLLMNSLYGKFGMDPDLALNKFYIVNDIELDNLMNDKSIIILTDPIVLNISIDNSSNYLVSTSFKSTKSDDDDLNNSSSLNVNIAIASAITAYSRIIMSQYLADDQLNIYYTDTDSITVDKPLDNKYIGNDLGKFKLETEYKEAIFLAPKVYAGYTTDGKYICKIKGFTDTVPRFALDELKTLLNINNHLNLEHNKSSANFNYCYAKGVNKFYY